MKPDRRQFLAGLGGAGLATAFFDTRGAFAQALVATPEQTEGPYYPTTLPLDTDNDLLLINDAITPAIGTISYLSGRILTASGSPIQDARVEIWQADSAGTYIHPQSNGFANRDRNFQGFGRFLTGSTGEYLFRTIRAGLYTGRTRHIHLKVKIAGRPEFITQVYYEGEPGNANDGILNGIRDVQARASVIVPWIPIPDSAVGAVAARFDVVIGVTAASPLFLRLTNVTDASRNPVFSVGDSWRLDLAGAAPSSRVNLRLWRDNADMGVSGPYGPLTNGSGAWSLSGNFGASDRGAWQIQALVGGGPGGPVGPGNVVASQPVALSIV